jgi:hypothetical protein
MVFRPLSKIRPGPFARMSSLQVPPGLGPSSRIGGVEVPDGSADARDVAPHRPALAQRFTVVYPDLRGYGDSAKPASDETHAAHSKRAMAQDQLEVMQTLGFERYSFLIQRLLPALGARRVGARPDALSEDALSEYRRCFDAERSTPAARTTGRARRSISPSRDLAGRGPRRRWPLLVASALAPTLETADGRLGGDLVGRAWHLAAALGSRDQLVRCLLLGHEA